MVNKAAFSEIFGNENLKKQLCGFAEKNAFPNSLIISGPEGSGKHTFALITAMCLACGSENKPCLECNNCRKIRLGISPDVIVIDSKDKKSIGVEKVRLIKDSAYIKPNDLECKVYIINDADTMTVQAQNALLKLFEEPPENVYFILLCVSSAGLLATVRSRAPELRTQRFTGNELSSLLISHSEPAKRLSENDPDSFRRIIHISDGSYGKAISLIENRNKKQEESFENTEKLINALSGTDNSEFLLLMLASATNRDAFSETLKMMMRAMRDILAVKKCRSFPELMFFRDVKSAKDRGSGFTVKKLLCIIDELQRAEQTVTEASVNLQTAATAIAIRLKSI